MGSSETTANLSVGSWFSVAEYLSEENGFSLQSSSWSLRIGIGARDGILSIKVLAFWAQWTIVSLINILRSWYKKSELGTRVAIYCTAATLAGAIGIPPFFCTSRMLLNFCHIQADCLPRLFQTWMVSLENLLGHGFSSLRVESPFLLALHHFGFSKISQFQPNFWRLRNVSIKNHALPKSNSNLTRWQVNSLFIDYNRTNSSALLERNSSSNILCRLWRIRRHGFLVRLIDTLNFDLTADRL